MRRTEPMTRRTFALAAGLFAGLFPRPSRAGGGSRSGRSASVAGPIKIEQGIAMGIGQGKIQAPMDAIYWLDYAGARLYAAIPAARQTPQDVTLLREFAERDLVADFALRTGDTPRFLMQTASLGGMGGGSAILLVIETSTRQVAAYQARPRAGVLDPRPEFDRLQLLPYDQGVPPATKPPGSPPPEPIVVAGPLLIQQGSDGIQAPLEVVYWLDDATSPTPRLHAALPSMRRTGTEAQVLSGVGARDLAADFQLKPGVTPRLLLNCASLGARMQGGSALFVIETTTKQIAAYTPSPRALAGANASAEISLTQIKSYLEAAPPPLPTPRESSGPGPGS
jgi:hypothetical protein